MNTDKMQAKPISEISAIRVPPEKHSLIPAMGAIFGLLFTLYLFTFNGQFTSIDELALYARAESIVQQHNFDTPQIAFAAYHNHVGDSEPGYAIAAAPLYWLAHQVGRLNNIHVLMLLNPLLTAATAAILYATAIQLGYSRWAGLVAALAFGLATLAWPYARTFYREPLVAFGWMLALYGLVRWRYGGDGWFALLSLALIGMMVFVKATAVFGVFILLAGLARNRDRKQLIRAIISLILLFLVAIALFQAAYWLRYDRIWGVGNLDEWTLGQGLIRIYGQLFSPGKGLLFYMPVITLTIPGVWLLWPRHRAVTLAVTLPLLTMVVAYSTYGAWYGGQSWGARFLVSALPLLMLTIAPLWDGAARWRWVTAGVIVLGVIWQFPVLVTNWWAAYVPLYESGGVAENEAGLTAVSLSPPLMQWKIWEAANLDLLWLHPDPAGLLQFSPFGLGLFAAVVIAGAMGWLVWRHSWSSWWLGLPPLLAMGMLLIFGGAAVTGYEGLTAVEGQEISAWLSQPRPEPYTVVTLSNEFHIYFYQANFKDKFIHHWLSPDQTSDFEPILAATTGRWLSLMIDRVHKRPEASGQELEWWLNEKLFRANSDWVGGYELTRYANLPLNGWDWQPADLHFGDVFDVGLTAVNQQTFALSDSDNVVGVQIEICRRENLPAHHNLFVHLVGTEAVINGFDGPIRYGGMVAETWEDGDCLIERRAIPIPPDAPLGQYNIIMGFNTDQGSVLLNGGDDEYAVLTQVEITSSE